MATKMCYEGYGIIQSKMFLAPSVFVGALVHLFINDVLIVPTMKLADFTPPVGGWYAPFPLITTTMDEGVTPAGDFVIAFPHITYRSTDPADPVEQLIGFLVTLHLAGPPISDRVLMAHRFPAPVILALPTDLLTLEPRILTGQPAGD